MGLRPFLYPRTFLYALLILAALFLGAAGGVFVAITYELPEIRQLEQFRPSAITRIYSADKVLLAELFTEKREPVPLHAIPDTLKKAVVATEDRQFYTHPGIYLRGILRAAVKDIKAGEFVEGASTITQQLAKTLFLTPRKTLIRKLREAFLAFQIERRYTKDEILGMYLNQVYFGSGAYGVEAAARIFFGKSASRLTLPECALIAGMPKSPSRYSPLVNPTLALKRRAIVLEQMAVAGIITQSQHEEAKQAPLNLARGNETGVKAPYFLSHVKDLLEKEVGERRLYREGLTIYTTLNHAMQEAAVAAVDMGLEQVAARRQKQGLSNDEQLQAALVCLDGVGGGILTMVGGRSFDASAFNRVTMARRQPGSAFKPVVYALAVERGFEQNDLIWDAPIVFRGATADDEWLPQNFSGAFKGEITLRVALAWSLNVPAVRLLNKVGANQAVQFAHLMGFNPSLAGPDPNLSVALGTVETTLLELTAAYAVFPGQGVWTEPFAVLEVVDRNGRTLWKPKTHRRTVMSPQGAAIITDMLRAVVTEGTAEKARRIDRPLAGKTGTTDGYRDALFVGFSPTLVAGVWVGLDNHEPLGEKETGAKAALPIWIDFMEQALRGRPHHTFDLPEGVTTARIDSLSGRLASEDCPNGVEAVFRTGQEPREYCRDGRRDE